MAIKSPWELAASVFGKLRGSAARGESTKVEAATQLPPPSTPKVKSNAQAFPSFTKTAKATGSPLAQTDRRLTQTDVTNYRTGSSTWAITRDFVAASPDLSSAVFAYLRVAITRGYLGVAKNLDGTFNPEATALLQQIISRLDVLPNYDNGFCSTMSIRSVAESMAKELIQYGSMSMELVLDKSRLPSYLQPVSVTNIKFIQDPKGGLKPRQDIAGEQVDLDIPTYFYAALDQDLLEAYSSSFLEPAMKAVVFSESFVADLHRVVKRAVHPRQDVKINWDKFQKLIPAEAQHNQDKLTEFMDSVIGQIETTINNLGVDEAFVHYDFIEVDRDNNGNISLAQEWTFLSQIANAKLATGAKTLPAILGHGAGSQNIASTESMLFVKNAAGAVQYKLNEVFSRAFTLALRLFGMDVTVEFKFDEIDLRPESELEAFKQTKQSRILELLSLGLISDEQASLELTGRLPAAGAPKLSGTFFKSAQGTGNANPNGESNGGSALNKSQQSDAPAQGRGQNNKSNPQKAEADGTVVALRS